MTRGAVTVSVRDGRHGAAALAMSTSGRHVVAFDGALANADELLGELGELGELGATGDDVGDAQLVAAVLAAWGVDGLDRLRGPFAVAAWDDETQCLVLARDHLGIRPLYLCRVPGDGGDGWLFGSHLGPILASGRYERRANDRTIYRYLRFRVHEDGRETFFDGIERVEPGEAVTISAAGVERRPFSHLRTELAELATRQRPYDETVVSDYRGRLDDAVRRSLASVARVGTSLSGGVASSAITLDADRLTSGVAQSGSVAPQLSSYSAVFPGSLNDEEVHVDAVVAAIGGRLASTKVAPTPTEFKNDLREFVRTQEEPLVSTGAYAQYRVMREAAPEVDVLVDGQGGDETLAGYGPHHLVHLRALRSRSIAAAVAEAGRSADVLYRRGRPAIGDRLHGRKDVPVESLLDGDFVAAHADEQYHVEGRDLRGRLLDDVFAGSLPARLRYADRNARRFGLTTSSPLLDLDLLRFTFGLVDEALVKDGLGKRVLRDATHDLLPPSVAARRDKVGFTTPQGEWFMRLKNHIYGVFLSESFANRPYVDQTAVLHAFEGWIKGTNSIDSMTVWRLLNLELWLQEFIDEHDPDETDESAPQRVKTDYEPNARKRLDLALSDGTVVRRYPLRTDLFAREDDLDEKALSYVDRFFAGLPDAGGDHSDATAGRWFFFISEKIVAITQGRSYFIWDIKVGRPARVLSRYVTRTPAGIGLGSPFTMQLAIEEAGLARVLYASAGGAVGRLIGRRGLFYDLVGGDIRAIDGPTEYSVYPANVSAKLGPKDPDDVAARLSAAIRERVPEAARATFGGTVVMDANDIGRNVLGKDAPGPKAQYEAMFTDNPLGQGSEQTPMAVVFEKPSA